MSPCAHTTPGWAFSHPAPVRASTSALELACVQCRSFTILTSNLVNAKRPKVSGLASCTRLTLLSISSITLCHRLLPSLVTSCVPSVLFASNYKPTYSSLLHSPFPLHFAGAPPICSWTWSPRASSAPYSSFCLADSSLFSPSPYAPIAAFAPSRNLYLRSTNIPHPAQALSIQPSWAKPFRNRSLKRYVALNHATNFLLPFQSELCLRLVDGLVLC